MTETFTCCHCGQEHPLENRVMVGDDALCGQCANEETVICSRCGERIYRDDNAGDENTSLCQPCYDRHYGLAAVVQEQFQLDPTEKNVLFLFCGTKTDRIKGLIFEGDGYLLVYKRLSAGRFRWPRTQEEAMAITQEQFDLLMQGMTIVSSIRQVNPKRLC